MSSREAQQLPLHWPQAAGLLQSEIAFNRRLLTHFYQLFHVQHEINRVLFNIRSLHITKSLFSERKSQLFNTENVS